MIYYYFSQDNKRLRHGDGRLIKTGITHRVKGSPILCRHGLHANKRIIDALRYAPGAYLWIVKLGGDVVHDSDKSVSTERTYLAGFNAEKTLRHFARRQALINIEKIEPHCSDSDYSLILEWLNTGNEELRSAAESVASSTARSAAAYAAEYAAEYAARSAAWSTAGSAARSAADKMLMEMLPTRIKRVIKEQGQ